MTGETFEELAQRNREASAKVGRLVEQIRTGKDRVISLKAKEMIDEARRFADGPYDPAAYTIIHKLCDILDELNEQRATSMRKSGSDER